MKNQQELPTTLSRFFAAFQAQGGFKGLAEEIAMKHCDAATGILGCKCAGDAAREAVMQRLKDTDNVAFLAALKCDGKDSTTRPSHSQHKKQLLEVKAQIELAIAGIAKEAQRFCQQMQAEMRIKPRISAIKSDARKKKSRRNDDETRHVGGAVKGNLQRQGHFQGSFAT